MGESKTLPWPISGPSLRYHLTIKCFARGVRSRTSELAASCRLAGLIYAPKGERRDLEVDCVHDERRPAWRRRMQDSGMSRVAGQLAVPAVLGLVIGVVLAFQSG